MEGAFDLCRSGRFPRLQQDYTNHIIHNKTSPFLVVFCPGPVSGQDAHKIVVAVFAPGGRLVQDFIPVGQAPQDPLRRAPPHLIVVQVKVECFIVVLLRFKEQLVVDAIVDHAGADAPPKPRENQCHLPLLILRLSWVRVQ